MPKRYRTYKDLQLTLERIISMKKSEYSKMLKEKVEKAALKYLLEKRGKKGSEIEFDYLEMADYLAPFNKQTIEEKCEMFAIKNSMIEIPANFSSECEIECECGAREDMKHIYECEKYGGKKNKIPFEKIFNGNLNEQIAVYNEFKQSMENRKKLNTTSPPWYQFVSLLSKRD